MSQIIQSKNIILAVVGLPGSGKTEATNYLVNKTGWPKVYFGQTVLDEAKKRFGDLNEAGEREVREELRNKLGMGALAILNLPAIRKYFKNSCVIIESLYSWEEYIEVKKEFGALFKVLAVYSPPEVREKRMVQRKIRPLTFNEFISRDYSQIENAHQAGPIARADFTIVNDGSIKDLHDKIDKIIERLNES